MTVKTIGYLALTVALIAATAGYFQGLGNDKARAAAQQNIELKAKVDALSKDSETHKALADAAQQEIKDRDAKIASLKARRTSALHASATASAPSGATTADPSIGGSATGASDEASLANQIIAAQDKQIAALGVEVSGLRAALDLKDRALATAEQRARGLEIALDAQRHASRSQRWLGRIEGVAVGIAIGYVLRRF